jgi:hypothetical protein
MKWRLQGGEWQSVPMTDDAAAKVFESLPLETRMDNVVWECDEEAVFSLALSRGPQMPQYCVGKAITRISIAAADQELSGLQT